MSTFMFIMQMIIALGGDPTSEACQIYPKNAIVTEVNEANDTFTATDVFGNDWVVDGSEDWLVGDIVSMTMYNNMTTNTIYDDVVLTAKYEGYSVLF